MLKVIDVSKHNGNIVWGAVADDPQGIDGVIIRAGYGRHKKQKDPCFEANYSNAKAAGLEIGAYWYSYAETPAQARAEAAVCLDSIKGKQFSLPIYFDIEDKIHQNLSMDECSEIAAAFCNTLEDAGYFAGIYSYDSFFGTHLKKAIPGRYSCWAARIGSKPKHCTSFAAWQCSWTGKVEGIIGNVDMNEFYKDFPGIIRKNKLNGYK